MNAISPLLQKFVPCALASRPGDATSLRSSGRFSIGEFLVFLLLFVAAALAQPAAATTTVAQTGLSCAGARAATSCTAGEFVTTVTISSQTGFCVSGGYYLLTGDVKLDGPNADRYDIGFFVGEGGNAPEASSTSATCSVATFPTGPAPWFSSSGNTCGDFRANGVDTPTIQGMKVYCQADASGNLAVPYVLTYTQDSTGACTGPTDVKVGNSSKCNKGTASVSGVTVLPAMTKTDNVSSRVLAGTTTSVAYTVGFSNLNAGSLNAVFTDPPPSGYTVSSITCSSIPSGKCPTPCSSGTCSASAVADITQGAGLSISIPPAVNSTTPARMAFVINGSYVAPTTAGTFTNTAKAVVNGYSQTVSDTITVVAPLTVEKAFSAISIVPNDPAKLTIKLTNPNPSVAISGVAFTDVYPSGLKNAATTNLTNTCGSSTATASAGGNSLALSGGSIEANSSCTISVDVTSSTAGSYPNNAGTVTTSNAGSSSGNTATLVVMAPPKVSESFTPSAVPIYSDSCSGCTSVFAVTLTNSNTVAIGGVAFTDTYSSSNLVNIDGASWTCNNGASGKATAGTSSLILNNLSGLIIPAKSGTSDGSCTVSVTVKGTVGGTYYATNTTGIGTVVTTSNAGSATAAQQAKLDVKLAAPTVTKSFSPSVVAVGGLSTLTIKLENPSATVDITGAAFTDSYPSGMTNNGAASTTCSDATATATTGGTSLSLSGATIKKSGSCTVTVQVKATTTGNNSLPAGAVTSSNSVANGSAVLAMLYVAKKLELSTSPSTVPNDGTTKSTITATITDPAGAAVPGDTVKLICTGSALPQSQTGTTGTGGQVSFDITDTQMETVTCTATDSVLLTASVEVTFSSVGSFNAFERTTAAGSTTGHIYTKLAGTAFDLDVVAIAGTSQASSFSGNVKLELVANTGDCPTSGTVVQTIPSAAIAGGRSKISFAAVTDAYQDVRVRITYPAATPPIVICSTDNFAIRPARLILWTDAYAGWGSVPAAATLGHSGQVTPFALSASAKPVVTAGKAFTLYATTTTGTNYSGKLTLDTDKLKVQKTDSETNDDYSTKISEGVVGTLTPTSLTETGLTANSVVSANLIYSEVGYLYLQAGAYRDRGFASVDGSNKASDEEPNDCVKDSTSDSLEDGKYGCLIGNTTTVPLGRFIPDHFGLIGSVTTRSDIKDPATPSPFTYMDEPMQFKLTVTAYRYVAAHADPATSDVTQNYAGKFAKLDAATLCNGNLGACGDSSNYGNWFATDNGTKCAAGAQCMGLGAVSGDKALSGRLALDIASSGSSGSAQPSSSWSAGLGTFTANVVFKRDAAGPDGSYSALQVGGKPLDSDGVTLPLRNSPDTAHFVDLDVKEKPCNPDCPESNFRRWLFAADVRFGRLRLSNAFGSEKSSLQMPIQAQYWSGKSWVLNADDNLTALPATAFALSGALASKTSASAVNLTGGNGVLTLVSPNTTGSVDVAINLGTTGGDKSCLGVHSGDTGVLGGTAASLPWLRSQNGSCAATYDRDPSARATFGIYSAERRRTVHVRELY